MPESCRLTEQAGLGRSVAGVFEGTCIVSKDLQLRSMADQRPR
jgi:hypothetical protein